MQTVNDAQTQVAISTLIFDGARNTATDDDDDDDTDFQGSEPYNGSASDLRVEEVTMRQRSHA